MSLINPLKQFVKSLHSNHLFYRTNLLLAFELKTYYTDNMRFLRDDFYDQIIKGYRVYKFQI